MSRAGSCPDNAVGESFFATLKTEYVYRHPLPTRTRARQGLIAWFDRYNRIRRHSYCQNRSPITYENIKRSLPSAAA